MFAYQECIGALKSLARSSQDQDTTYCQQLDLYSRKFGFNSFGDFKKALANQPTDRLGKVSLKLMRLYCQVATPSLNTDYYEFYSTGDWSSISYYSSWIGWDKTGREVRVPRPLDGQESIDGMREFSDNPIYVVENDKQFLAWRYKWHGAAMVPGDLAKSHFLSLFDQRRSVCEDVDMELVRAHYEDYDNNVATQL